MVLRAHGAHHRAVPVLKDRCDDVIWAADFGQRDFHARSGSFVRFDEDEAVPVG